MRFIPEKIIVEEDASNHKETLNILKRLGNSPVVRVNPGDYEEQGGFMDMKKETLRLVRFRGEFLKPCPGTQRYICCGYQILNIGTNCPLDCSYCILQAYFNKPCLRVFVNLKEELKRIGGIIDSQPERIFRVGTGEFTDSLALDHITGWNRTLCRFFMGRPNAILELKTKTDLIGDLLSSPYRDRIVVSWSLNSPYIASREEHGAPSIEKRLRAAKKCQEEGYVLGFHFDPIIRHANWRDGYKRAIEMMDKYIDPGKIIWISLGGLRYMPYLKSIIRSRHPATDILDGEFVQGLDGKMRYFKPLRVEIYSFLGEEIEKWTGKTGLYLCMESDEVWKESLGWSPKESKGLSTFLDNRVRKFFGDS